LTDDWRNGGFGVYVHWPFCAAKCPYCDFNSHVRTAVDQDRWRRALVAEVRAVAVEVPDRTVDTVFFGGGTPSLMPPETVDAVMSAVREAWTLAPDAEVTLEANPTSVDAGRFRGYRDAGVNRLSMGVQALNDADLRALGRRHDVAEALHAFTIARTVFSRVSFDLIYARQYQDTAAWQAELGRAVGLAIDHLSLYQLTIEPDTRFGDLAERGRLRGLPDAGRAAELYEATGEICTRAGLGAYEISNHARPGAECRHNLVYWRYGDYAGIGPGAHGRLTIKDRVATAAIRSPEAWIAAVEQTGSGMAERTPLAPPDQATEMLMMGLRLAEGVDLARYAALAGAQPGGLHELGHLGLVAVEGARLWVTAAGRPVLDAVLRRLLAGASR
jgi:putative oxygen-independent coproporphyrinogen III oxidase